MNKGYSDIFFDWLLSELRDVSNFTLLTDKNTISHCKYDIKIYAFQAFSFEVMLLIKLNDYNISELLPELLKNNYLDLYFKIRKYYLDGYEEADKILCAAVLDKFVINNLMNN